MNHQFNPCEEPEFWRISFAAAERSRDRRKSLKLRIELAIVGGMMLAMLVAGLRMAVEWVCQ